LSETRNDLDDGLRFVHIMDTQTTIQMHEFISGVKAVKEELEEKGLVNATALQARRPAVLARTKERASQQAYVAVHNLGDKYQAGPLPEIDCASLIPICKARCCRLRFPLSFQDLDEGVVRWEYGQPYIIRFAVDGYCSHSDPTTRACTIHAQRPVPCRVFDCRQDRRIWLDFEQRVPAPEEALAAEPFMVMKIGKRPGT